MLKGMRKTWKSGHDLDIDSWVNIREIDREVMGTRYLQEDWAQGRNEHGICLEKRTFVNFISIKENWKVTEENWDNARCQARNSDFGELGFHTHQRLWTSDFCLKSELFTFCCACSLTFQVSSQGAKLNVWRLPTDSCCKVRGHGWRCASEVWVWAAQIHPAHFLRTALGSLL